jgi:hypothetical protein
MPVLCTYSWKKPNFARAFIGFGTLGGFGGPLGLGNVGTAEGGLGALAPVGRFTPGVADKPDGVGARTPVSILGAAGALCSGGANPAAATLTYSEKVISHIRKRPHPAERVCSLPPS